jgi:serine protease inhibitor
MSAGSPACRFYGVAMLALSTQPLGVACTETGQWVEISASLYLEGYAMRKPFCVVAMCGIVPALVIMMNPISPAQTPSSSAEAVPSATDTEAIAALAKANDRFALDLLHKLSAKTEENAFFSPHSVSAALAMTWAGARGQTADQMSKVLHFSDLAAASVTSGFRGLQQALAQTQQQTGAELSIANSLWPEKEPEHPFLPEYLKLVERNFGSIIRPMDYRSGAEQARQEINRWVEDKTNNRIKDLLHQGDVDAMTRLVLVNAIYFKAPWFEPFSKSASAEAQFHLADGKAKPITLMHSTHSASYAEVTVDSSPVQILSLEYRDPGKRAARGGLSFVAILPKEPNGLAAVEKALTAEKLHDWLGELKSARVEIYLPKFRLEDRYSLGQALEQMGMTDAFTDKADFSGMNGAHNLYITKAIHQTFVDVNEEGTEAAAATGVAIGVKAMLPTPASLFRADHPFLFLIRNDATGSILFLGRLADPPAPSSAAGN